MKNKEGRFFWVIAAIFLVITFGIVIGCTKRTGNIGKDGYYFEQESFVRTDFPIEIVLMESEEAVGKELAKHKNVAGEIVEGRSVAAFSTIRKNETRCTIYMVDPKISYTPEFYGHELVHCIYGVWHKEPQS